MNWRRNYSERWIIYLVRKLDKGKLLTFYATLLQIVFQVGNNVQNEITGGCLVPLGEGRRNKLQCINETKVLFLRQGREFD